MYYSFALAGHRGTCLRPLHIFALLCFDRLQQDIVNSCWRILTFSGLRVYETINKWLVLWFGSQTLRCRCLWRQLMTYDALLSGLKRFMSALPCVILLYVTSAKEVCIFCLCVFVCQQDISGSCRWILIKRFGEVGSVTSNNRLDLGGDQDHDAHTGI